MEAKQIEEQIEGLTAKGKVLREKEAIFLKASGLVQTIEKYRMEISDAENDLEDLKDSIYELKAEKAEAVKATLITMQDKITALLPEGDGIVHINDKFIIGWLIPNKPLVPFEGLSGGQKIVFGQALGKSLLGDAKETLLIYEAAEVDKSHLNDLLDRIVSAKEDSQVIVNTWVGPETLTAKGPFPFKVWNHIGLK